MTCYAFRALKLWSEICFVEDTPALKLQWNKTNLYSGLLGTLNMNPAKAVPREKPVLPTMIPTSAPLELPSHDRVSKIQPKFVLFYYIRMIETSGIKSTYTSPIEVYVKEVPKIHNPKSF